MRRTDEGGRGAIARLHHLHRVLAVISGVGIVWSVTSGTVARSVTAGSVVGLGGELAVLLALTGVVAGAAALAPVVIAAVRSIAAGLARRRVPVALLGAGHPPVFVTTLRMTRPDAPGHPRPRAPGRLLPVA